MKRLLLLSMILLPTTLLGQGESRNLKLRTVGWEKVNQELYLKQGNGEAATYVKLKILRMCASHEVKVKSSGMLELFLKSGSEEEPVYKNVARASVSTACNRYLLMVFPRSEKTGRFPVRAIKDDAGASPMGSYRIYNFSNKTFNVGLGKKASKLGPKKDKLFQPDAEDQEQIPFAAWYEKSGKRKWLARNSWFYNEKKHLKFFIMMKQDARGRDKIETRALPDYYKPPTPPE